MNIIITGANGFIGSALCGRLASGNKVIGVDITGPAGGALNIAWEQADLTDQDSVSVICEKYSPDVVIHCAGVAHQKIGMVDSATYMRVNSEVTENLAKAAAKSNPGVCFIFFSSVSVYGEQGQLASRKGAKTLNLKTARTSRKDDPQITQITRIKSTKTNNNGVSEEGDCWPSSDYAVSKLDAEMRLIALFDEGKLHNLIILRLAPVYDRGWSLNLDRRVFAPGRVAYLRFGSGSQRMSALARPNLVEFIEFLSRRLTQINADGLTQRRKGAKVKNRRQETGDSENKERRSEAGNDSRRNLQIFNVCDAEPYEFNRIIGVFKKSGIQPNRPVISVPLSVVWFATRIAGIFFSSKREWIHSCYDKLACDLVFDNGRMMGTGFRAVHSLETIFDPQMASRKGAKTLR